MDRRSAAGWFLAAMISAGWAANPPGASTSAPGPRNADEFRAALLSKIPRFVVWPESALGAADPEVVIAVVGADRFVPLLEALLKDVRIGERPVTVRVLEGLDDLPRCQVLFVDSARTEAFARVPAARRSGILTVGENPRFTAAGGICNLSLADRKLTVNVRNARTAGLELQSRLLRTAEVER